MVAERWSGVVGLTAADQVALRFMRSVQRCNPLTRGDRRNEMRRHEAQRPHSLSPADAFQKQDVEVSQSASAIPNVSMGAADRRGF
jgi:hypothetical protein